MECRINGHYLNLPEDVVENLVKDYGKTPESALLTVETTHGRSAEIVMEKGILYIRFPMPTHNRAWTFDVWKAVMKLCEDWPNCRPVHGKEFEMGFQYVMWDEIP